MKNPRKFENDSTILTCHNKQKELSVMYGQTGRPSLDIEKLTDINITNI